MVYVTSIAFVYFVRTRYNQRMVRTRFAPSPTGNPDSVHLGFVIRALWNYAYAKKHNGQFILRIEDTDKERSRKDTEKAIFEVLKRFNIIWDEGPDNGGEYGPYRQSERLQKYQDAAHTLVEKGYAYYDFEAEKREKEEIKASYGTEEKREKLKERPSARNLDPKEALERVKSGEPYVVRAKIPEDKVFSYTDWILKKKISFYGKEVSDMILLKSDGFPTYHLAVVVDDVAMRISHVFRGQEWISSTPIHLHVYEGLGYKLPEIGHFSVILDPRTNKKFSKRDLTSLFGVTPWLEKGYLEEALLNYLMLLGWAPKDNKELFSLEEFVEAFDQDGVQKANPTFDAKKLEWMNSQYIQKLSDKELEEKIIAFTSDSYDASLIAETISLIKTRIKTLKEYEDIAEFFFVTPNVDISLFGENYKKHLSDARAVIESQDELDLAVLNDGLMDVIEKNDYHTGKFFMDLRIAITGKKFTPPINESMVILGKDETLKRINAILK